jgi:hypothetical protein
VTIAELRQRWTVRRDELRRLRAIVDGTTICEEVLSDLELISADEELTLKEAAARSGYSRDHLSRLIRQNKLTDVGRKHAPRLLASELPKRSPVARPYAKAYNPEADARSLVSSRR